MYYSASPALGALGYGFDGLATFSRVESPFAVNNPANTHTYDALDTTELAPHTLWHETPYCDGPSYELSNVEHVGMVLEVISLTDRRRGPSCSTRYVKDTEIPATMTGLPTATTAEDLEIVSLTERRRGPSFVSHPVKDDEIPTTITGVQVRAPVPVLDVTEEKPRSPIFPMFSYDFGDLSASFSASFVSRPLSPLLLRQSRKSSVDAYSPSTSPLISFSSLSPDPSDYRRGTSPPSSPRRSLHRLPTILSVQ